VAKNGTFRTILAINVFKQHKMGKKCTKNAPKMPINTKNMVKFGSGMAPKSCYFLS
jgi:flavoprotein